MRHMIFCALTGALLASGAMAQTSPAPAPSAPAAAPAASSSFTDADLKAFAHAAIAANKIQQDTSVAPADKQPKMLAALQAQGLDPVKFNAIAKASEADPALQKRIQTVAASDPSLAPPSAQGAPTPTP